VSLARAVLRLVSPHLDELMRSQERSYKKHIATAMKIANDTSPYYLASPKEKMRMVLSKWSNK
jgi:hypothetical protein